MLTIKLKRDIASEWAKANPILQSGEPGYEKDTGRLKIGDGSSHWLELDYYPPSQELQALINNALANVSGGDGGASSLALQNHINSLTPHPAYDDGPSLLLLYQNAKV